MRRSIITVLHSAAIMLAIAAIAIPPAWAASYSISKGDLLSIYVYRQEGMNMKVRVDDSGYIRFPVAGRIPAAGRSPSTIESVIASALSRNGFASPEVVVSIESFAPRKVYVLGAVKGGDGHTHDIPLGGEISALQVINASGGIGENADIDRIIVRRGGKDGITILPVPAKAILNGENVSDVWLEEGDTVVVPWAKSISVLGTVKNPGQFYPTPESPLTVSRVIALAGGVDRSNSLSEIRVTRGDKSFTVDIRALLEDGKGGNDMILEPGDVVFVPETRW